MAPLVDIVPDGTLAADGSRPRVAKFKRPMPPTFDSLVDEQAFKKGALAGACRIFCTQGWENTSSQLSIRDPVRPDTIWTNPAGFSLSCVNVSALIQVDLDGNIVGGPADAVYDVDAVSLHLAIYEKRPDVGSVIHGHTLNARTFSMQGREIDMICQDSCTFYKKCHVLPLKAANNARRNRAAIQDVLLDGKTLILQHKGLLTVGASVECALSYFIRMENLCKVQLLAEAAARGRGSGATVKVGEQEVAFTYENTGSEHHAFLMCMPYMERLARRGDGGHLL